MTLAAQNISTFIDWLLGTGQRWALGALTLMIIVTVVRGIFGKFTITRWLTLAVEVVLAFIIATAPADLANTVKSDFDTHSGSMPAAHVVEWPDAV